MATNFAPAGDVEGGAIARDADLLNPDSLKGEWLWKLHDVTNAEMTLGQKSALAHPTTSLITLLRPQSLQSRISFGVRLIRSILIRAGTWPACSACRGTSRTSTNTVSTRVR